jgi:ABC-type bacteriocin/lantibiotic exporter with double-glycine peptidase domain
MKLKGKKLQESQTFIIKLVNQALGGIKETIIYKKEEYFYKEFKNQNKILEELIFYKYFITSIPRFFLEFVAICTIVLIVCILFISGKTENTIPLISLISISSIRFIPSLNTITSSFSSIRFLKPSMEFVIKEISSIHSNKQLFAEKYNSSINDNLAQLHQGIILKDISFDYGEGRNKPVNNISLEISLGQSIGIIGKSGSGKSTLVDIIIGLLKPSSGKLLIDGINIDHKNLISGWQKQIGYIPQEIYLLDDTIERNIAFGIPKSEIDKNKIKNAIIYSQLQSFIQSLPLKENTTIGNRGVKLSGGQRQRLGIARALYNEPKVIILDEATSSLDEENEMKIIREVFNLKDKKTIIIVTHRYQTVHNCDNIFLLSKGSLLDSGSFNYLNKKYNLKNNF